MLHSRKDYAHIQEHISDELAAKLLNCSDIEQAKELVSEALASRKIGSDEPVFLLRAQDACALAALNAWVNDAHERNVNPQMIRAVNHLAADVYMYQRTTKVKTPDTTEPLNLRNLFSDEEQPASETKTATLYSGNIAFNPATVLENSSETPDELMKSKGQSQNS